MERRTYSREFRRGWPGLLLAAVIGLTGYAINIITASPIADPLLLAMLIGIAVGTASGAKKELRSGFALAPTVFIPIGIVFYGANHLNFAEFAELQPSMLALIIIIMLLYFLVITKLGKRFGQRKEITYLTATGSAICGASAIAITSPVVKAEPEDSSISLLAVSLSAVVALFIVFPFLATLCDLSNRTYGLLSGSVLQITGFVRAAVGNIPFLKEEMAAADVSSLSLSVKSTRYLGLLVALPLYASIVRKRFHIPWFLWAFLGAGLLGTWIYAVDKLFYTQRVIPFINPIYTIAWAIAMAAVGMNADAKQMFSNNGIKAVIMAFAGCAAATIAFFIGFYIIQSL